MMNSMHAHEEVHEIDHHEHHDHDDGGTVNNWIEDQEMWFNDHETEVQLDHVVVVDDDRSNGNFVMSYGSVDDDHDFPPLPDFPCISSSSSSSSSSCSSAPPAAATTTNLVKSSSSSLSSSSSSSSLGASTAKVDHSEKGTTDQKNEDQTKMETTEQEALLNMATDSMEIRNISSSQIDSSDCMDVMEELGDMDQFIDTDDIWHPSSLFPNCENLEEVDDDDDDDEEEEEGHQQQQRLMRSQGGGDDQKPGSEDLAMVFFEWLKSNKESISAEDLRSIKLKRSTIECAAKRLGGGKEGVKQLLKLILEWVQNHQLQKKRVGDQEEVITNCLASQMNVVNNNVITDQSNNPYSYLPSTNHPLPPVPWVNNPSHFSSSYENASWDSPTFSPVFGFMGDSIVAYHHHHVIPTPHHPAALNNTSINDYQMRDQSVQTWLPPQFSPLPPRYASFPDHHVSHHQAPPMPRVYAAAFGANNQYPCQLFHHQGHVDRIVRLGSSATKEARKKRMARQKRFFSHHHRSNQNHNQQQDQNNQNLSAMDQQQQHSRLGSDANCTGVHANQANWVFWPSTSHPSGAGDGAAATSTQLMVSDAAAVTAALPAAPASTDRAAMQGQQFQPQIGLDRRQGSKNGPEKNLKFLLQKVLKQSDVGNLGRIVLPKKEAETYLPELEARDGISIAMEDIGTSRTWNMRYRFWPNNKSRMYLLENTGDFVRSNGLQEGDFIVIYSDIKCGKYMIRGVKVRQPGSKMEGRKQGKAHRKLHSTSKTTGNGSCSTCVKETMM